MMAVAVNCLVTEASSKTVSGVTGATPFPHRFQWKDSWALVRHNLGTNFRTYWITWSARPTSDCGSVSPKASAIFFNRLREPPGITGTQKRIKGLSGGSPNSIRPADSYCRGAAPICWVTAWMSRSARWSKLRR